MHTNPYTHTPDVGQECHHGQLVHSGTHQFFYSHVGEDANSLLCNLKASLDVLSCVFWAHLVCIWNGPGKLCLKEGSKSGPVIPVRGEVFDTLSRDGFADPLEEVGGGSLKELGEVGHRAEFIHVWVAEVIIGDDGRDFEMDAGLVDGESTVVPPLGGVKGLHWDQTRLDAVQKDEEGSPVVEVGSQVSDIPLGQHGTEPVHHHLWQWEWS